MQGTHFGFCRPDSHLWPWGFEILVSKSLLSLALLLEDPMVAQGSDLLLLLGFGHYAAAAKLRTACFGLGECLCGGFCFQPFTSHLVCKQCSKAHVLVIKPRPVVFELPVVPDEVAEALRNGHVASKLRTLRWSLVSESIYFWGTPPNLLASLSTAPLALQVYGQDL